jgi:PAS domain S-box-containing protein
VAEQLFGYKAGEVIGKPVTILIPADRQDEEPDILARIRRGEPIQTDHRGWIFWRDRIFEQMFVAIMPSNGWYTFWVNARAGFDLTLRFFAPFRPAPRGA